ncbi:MAG TPA: hypothetical protein PKY01_05245 [Candidatus Hydrogenedentes bacterium]|nr:hypothetical protein [Candidatus Hydrogenedentota bacterium]
MTDMTRRQLIGGVVAGAVMSAAGGSARASEVKMPNNKDFYKADGTFNVEAAKEAYYDMMRRFNYPIVDRLKSDEFWAIDFGLGKFTEVGMAGIFWINNKQDDYFGHEIYLLPGQMIPEHRHMKTEEARPKMEGWQTRYGFVWTYGEGEPHPGDVERIPPSHRELAKARCATKVMPGEVTWLPKAEQWHFMLAGPEGAIVTEYASYHDGAGLRFTLPNAKL